MWGGGAVAVQVRHDLPLLLVQRVRSSGTRVVAAYGVVPGTPASAQVVREALAAAKR
ncbi:hypothetical protein GCM10010168_64070 [Actinoplanes ianthinogenes]|uniref:Uncharacterized protein n=1 Tax=Actinoplanes ianthinogenes TaxID=122358 RepID=A0ABM7LJB2_9ACTN|nr:hypothetical protein Aiant_00020 [Actinoplanes ianthinogenes]GGR36754.1 hypothetical protein GCM10010168_64070 [Actinoplanes ianthinogenes]